MKKIYIILFSLLMFSHVYGYAEPNYDTQSSLTENHDLLQNDDPFVLRGFGGGGGGEDEFPNDDSSDNENGYTDSPIGNGTWLLFLLLIPYALWRRQNIFQIKKIS